MDVKIDLTRSLDLLLGKLPLRYDATCEWMENWHQLLLIDDFHYTPLMEFQHLSGLGGSRAANFRSFSKTSTR